MNIILSTRASLSLSHASRSTFLLIFMTIQLPNVWEDELHNVIHMSYGTSAPLNSQDADGIIFIHFAQILSYGISRIVLKFVTEFPSVFAGSLPHSHLKVEP